MPVSPKTNRTCRLIQRSISTPNYRRITSSGKSFLPKTNQHVQSSVRYVCMTLSFYVITFPLIFLTSALTLCFLAKITYRLPASSGLCSASDHAKLESFLDRCQRLGYCNNTVPMISDIINNADDLLFQAVLKTNYHVLYHYYPLPR